MGEAKRKHSYSGHSPNRVAAELSVHDKQYLHYLFHCDIGQLDTDLIAGVIVQLFTTFAGWGSGAFPMAEGFTIVIGFLGPFAYLKYQEHTHYAGWSKEYRSLKEDRGAAGRAQPK